MNRSKIVYALQALLKYPSYRENIFYFQSIKNSNHQTDIRLSYGKKSMLLYGHMDVYYIHSGIKV